MHRLPYVHGGLPVHGRALVQLGGAEVPVDHAVGDADVPKHQKHVVEKCTFCYQRLAREEVPACMELCPARARHFGDFDDPDSEVSKLVKERSYEQLLVSEGTKPSVYYLV